MTQKAAESSRFPSPFVGRETELNLLFDSWRCAQNRLPQLVVLLADTGLGKTRLVHEFYRRVSAEQKTNSAGNKYWPDLLDPNPVTLRINPDMLAGDRFVEDMPWFWLGVRWQPPEQRNAEGHRGCGLLNGDTQKALEAHREPFQRHLQKLVHARAAGKTLGDAALSLALAATIPVIGVIYDKGRIVYDIIKAGKGVIRTPESNQAFDSEIALTAQKRDAEDRIRDFLVSLLDPRHKEMPTLPVILVLDDTQWADAATLRFVRNLFVDAARQGWPLMIMATCWETEWKEQANSLTANQPLETDPANVRILAHQLSELVELQAPTNGWSMHFKEIALPPFRDCRALEPLIDAAFPGLGPPARQYLLAEANGNPRILVEFLIQLKERAPSHWFFKGDFSGDLTAVGLNNLRALPTAYEEIVAKRIKRLESDDIEAYRTLVIAGAQGLRFFGSLIGDVAGTLADCSIGDISLALKRAETPRNFISLLQGSLLPGEFKDWMSRKEFCKICLEQWPDTIPELCRILRTWLISEGDKSDKCSEELLLLILDVSARDSQFSYAVELRIPALGHLVKGLQERQQFGEAVRRAKEISLLSAGLQTDIVLDALPPGTQYGVARCLLEARDLKALIPLINEHLSRTKSEANMFEVQWRRLKARALHMEEKYDQAIVAWDEAITYASGVAESPEYSKRMHISRLYVGLGQSWHLNEGWRCALRAYRKAEHELHPSKGIEDYGLFELRLASQIYMGIAETLYDAGHLSGASGAMRRAQAFLERRRDKDFANNPAQVHELLAQCLMRQGAWTLRLTSGDSKSAVDLLTLALQMREDLIRLVGETADTLSSLASSHSVLASALSRAGNTDRALVLVERAINIREDVIRRVGDQTAAQRQFALTLMSRGDIHRATRHFAEALHDYEAACSKREKIVESNNSRLTHQLRKDYRFLHYSWRKCGEIHLELHALENANMHLRKAFAVSRRIQREFTCGQKFPHEVIDLRNEYILWEILGRLAEMENRKRVAVRRYGKALILLEKIKHRYGLSAPGFADKERILGTLERLRPS